MPWPDRYECPDCGRVVQRPTGANVWGCVCGKFDCRCRMLDAIGCYRCGNTEGFPRHAIPRLRVENVAKSVILDADQTPFEREFTLQEINEKRRAYCERCVHEQFFLLYTNVDITCRLCGVVGRRGATLAHVLKE